MQVYSIEDIKEAFPWRNKPIFFLHMSVLLYFAALPFVPFGFTVWGRTLTYPQLALTLVGLSGMYAYFKGALRLRRAGWLYGFLVLNVVAQLLSIFNAPLPIADYGVGISVAIYSAVIFVLVNAIRSEALIKAIFVVMGGVVLIMALHSFILFVGGVQGGSYQPREQISLIGNELPIALAYLLIMYGSGLLFLFFREEDREVRSLRWVLASIWIYGIILTSAKAAHIAFLLLLIGVWFTMKRYRRQIVALGIIFLILFLYQWRFGSVVAGFYVFRTRALDADLIISDYANRGLALLIGDRETKARTRADVASINPDPESPTSRLAEFASATEAPSSSVEDGSTPSLSTSPPAALQPVVPMQESGAEASDGTVSAPVSEVTPTAVPVASGGETHVLKPTVTSPSDLLSNDSAEILFPDLEPVSIAPTSSSPQRLTKSIPETQYELDFFQRRWSDQGLRSSIELRTRGILTGWYMGAAYPLTGAGPGQSGFFFNHFSEVIRERSRDPAYLWFLPGFMRGYFKNDQRWSSALTNTHNIFLNAWAETGLLGLTAIAGLLATVFVKGLRVLWHTYRLPTLDPPRLLLPTLLGLLFIHQTIFLFVHPWIWSILALTYAAVDIKINPQEHQTMRTEL